MIDLADTTIIIPLRLDSIDRLRNLTTVVRYFKQKSNAIVHVVEDDKANRCTSDIYKGNKYTLLLNESPLFHKTRCINQGVKESKTPYFAVYDVDVILKEDQLNATLELLRTKQADVVYPYDGRFMNVPETLVGSIVNTLSVDHIPDSSCSLGLGMPELTTDRQSFGGAVFFNKEKFIEGGMANENFITYGPEDAEFWVRFKKLGYVVKRVAGPVYHMNHSRGLNSNEQHPMVAHNHDEFKKILAMNPDELKTYVASWSWRNND